MEIVGLKTILHARLIEEWWLRPSARGHQFRGCPLREHPSPDRRLGEWDISGVRETTSKTYARATDEMADVT